MDFVDELADTIEIQEFVVRLLYKKKRFSDVFDFCERYNFIDEFSSLGKSDLVKIYHECRTICSLESSKPDSKSLYITPKNPIIFVNDSKSFQIAKVKIKIYVNIHANQFSQLF